MEFDSIDSIIRSIRSMICRWATVDRLGHAWAQEADIEKRHDKRHAGVQQAWQAREQKAVHWNQSNETARLDQGYAGGLSGFGSDRLRRPQERHVLLCVGQSDLSFEQRLDVFEQRLVSMPILQLRAWGYLLSY